MPDTPAKPLNANREPEGYNGVRADALILTNTGYTPISALKAGDVVVAANGERAVITATIP